MEGRKKSVETLLYVLVSSNKVCWVPEASVYTFMFSCTLRLYMCNVIAAEITKRATQTRFLGNYKI